MTDELPDERPQRRREYSGASSTLGVAALIVITVGAALWYLEFRDGGGATAFGTPGLGIVSLPPELNPSGKPPAAQQGRAAPNFKLRTPEGGELQLSDLRGDFVLLNFWASWCGPCRGETPDLQALYMRSQPNAAMAGLVILGVNQQEEPEPVRAFVAEFGLTYPIALDRSGEVSDAYRVGRGLPMSFLVNPSGVIEQIYYGRLTPEKLASIATQARAGLTP
ncbi:MAG: TlpA disulfide reductase family protein [Tepidiformaceae bacterium]